MNHYYENIEFNLTNGQTDYDLDANQSGFMSKFGAGTPTNQYANFVEIRTDEEITVKINLTTNDSITISSTDVPYTIEEMDIQNMFLSNSSGNTAKVKLRFQLKEQLS